jgi:hypothetical protein
MKKNKYKMDSIEIIGIIFDKLKNRILDIFPNHIDPDHRSSFNFPDEWIPIFKKIDQSKKWISKKMNKNRFPIMIIFNPIYGNDIDEYYGFSIDFRNRYQFMIIELSNFPLIDQSSDSFNELMELNGKIFYSDKNQIELIHRNHRNSKIPYSIYKIKNGKFYNEFGIDIDDQSEMDGKNE